MRQLQQGWQAPAPAHLQARLLTSPLSPSPTQWSGQRPSLCWTYMHPCPPQRVQSHTSMSGTRGRAQPLRLEHTPAPRPTTRTTTRFPCSTLRTRPGAARAAAAPRRAPPLTAAQRWAPCLAVPQQAGLGRGRQVRQQGCPTLHCCPRHPPLARSTSPMASSSKMWSLSSTRLPLVLLPRCRVWLAASRALTRLRALRPLRPSPSQAATPTPTCRLHSPW
mmetsp:Transcript_8907/g.22030  ORF Transcript_8907/g.22030 Transcript_8907/m.22030 type:complete len:220 (-) Transcript_8907:2190-2849(-)